MTDDAGASLTVSNGSHNLTIVDATAVLNLFEQMLLAMERRLVDRIDSGQRDEGIRWTAHEARHDREQADNTARVVARFERVEGALLVVERAIDVHLTEQHDARIRADARMRPVVTGWRWLWAHWRDIVLLAIGLFAAGTFVVDFLSRVLGGNP